MCQSRRNSIEVNPTGHLTAFPQPVDMDYVGNGRGGVSMEKVGSSTEGGRRIVR